MKLIADTHLHIYPFYDVGQALGALIDNLGALDSEASRVGCLTERFDCNIYQQLTETPDSVLGNAYSISVADGALEITRNSDNAGVTLLPGQQVITAENLEILMLNSAVRISEGATADETVRMILDSGGLPVIAWGFGKWLGGRGKVVEDLVQRFNGNEIAIGDSTMRPVGWPVPGPYKRGKARGIRTIFGSDPLPFNGEEVRPGSYATRITLPRENRSIAEVFRSLLQTDFQGEAAGKRSSPLELAGRMQGHRRKGRIAGS